MPGTGALQAIRDAIAHLEEASAPVEDEIREAADRRIAELEKLVAENRLELARWRRALARVEGAPVTGVAARTRSRGGRASSL